MTSNLHLDLKRIQNLTDATFAVAMTLLILEIRIPQGLNPAQFREYFMQHLVSDIFIYVIGFVTLGIFWIGSHYHHNSIHQTDRVSSWLNILFLMTICLIPFGISLIRAYKSEKLNLIFYCAVLIIASLINLLLLVYAWKRHHTKQHFTAAHYANTRLRILIPILLYSIDILIAFYSVQLALWLLLGPLLLHLHPEKYGSYMRNRHAKV